MTWDEFKKMVDKMLAEAGKDGAQVYVGIKDDGTEYYASIVYFDEDGDLIIARY